mgnify:FL=1
MSQNRRRTNRKTAPAATAQAASATSSTSRSTRSSVSANRGMKITHRVVDSRQHTTGYVAGGKTYSVSEILSMVNSGKVKGVQQVGNHIQSLPGSSRLTDLPTRVAKN